MTMSQAFPNAEPTTPAAPQAAGQIPSGGIDPNLAPAPGLSAPPSGQPEPAAPAAPQFDPQEVARLREQAQYGQQLATEIQQYARQQEQAQRMQQARSQVDQSRQQIYSMAQNMPPAEAFTFIQQQEAQLQQGLLTQQQQAFAEQQRVQQQQAEQLVEQLSAPQYAEHLLQQHGLPMEYKSRLVGVSPRRMDEYIPIIKSEHTKNQTTQQQIATLQAQIDQMNRTGAAQQIQQSGAHISSGGNATPIPTETPIGDKGTTQHLRDVLGRQGWSIT